ncbi:MAG: rod shape-determining protein MreC [Rikenellaceae bacterium]|nr:rod shape-determining protein MreC [Rikenellaceae bacterium]
MYRFFLFLKKISFLLLFIAIETMALRYFSGSSTYNQAKMINTSNFLLGDLQKGIGGVKHFFSLGRENRRLNEEVAALRERLQWLQETADTLPETQREYSYYFSTARVVNNSITLLNNYFTLDKGIRDGVETEMAVISNGAIAGYILDCSERFSVAISLLNTDFRTSGRIRGEDYFGSIFWDGIRMDEVVLSEIPKYAPIQIGDTIVTTDYSSYFPPDLLIGTVTGFELINGTYYDARVKLSADMAGLRHVVLIDYLYREEKMELEHETASRASIR